MAEPVLGAVRGEDDVARPQRDWFSDGGDQPAGTPQDDMEAGAREGREPQAPGTGRADPAGEGLAGPGAADDLADDVHAAEAIPVCAQARMSRGQTNMAACVRCCLDSKRPRT
jgi:hypothetical protein